MRRLLAGAVKRGFRAVGLDIRRTPPPWPSDFEADDIALYREVAPYTLTSPEAVFALSEAVRYVVSAGIPGAIVECGVWKGGSMMAVARTLLQLGVTDRDLYLFDTFEGMTEPNEKDVQFSGEPASELLAGQERSESTLWVAVGLERVQEAIASVGYPAERVHFVRGKVEETLPEGAPAEIALLRLDTDWYESTKHELVHLFPRLSPRGVLILDDYGWWRGAGEAVDEYLRETGTELLLVRIDHEGRRVAVKL